jgi:hypothetical protein
VPAARVHSARHAPPGLALGHQVSRPRHPWAMPGPPNHAQAWFRHAWPTHAWFRRQPLRDPWSPGALAPDPRLRHTRRVRPLWYAIFACATRGESGPHRCHPCATRGLVTRGECGENTARHLCCPHLRACAYSPGFAARATPLRYFYTLQVSPLRAAAPHPGPDEAARGPAPRCLPAPCKLNSAYPHPPARNAGLPWRVK